MRHANLSKISEFAVQLFFDVTWLYHQWWDRAYEGFALCNHANRIGSSSDFFRALEPIYEKGLSWQLLSHVHNLQSPEPSTKKWEGFAWSNYGYSGKDAEEMFLVVEKQSSTGTMNGKALLFEILEPYRNMWPSLSEPLEMTIIGNLIRDVIMEASKPTTVRYVSNSWRSKLQNPFDAGKLLSSDSSKLGIPKCAISVPRFFDEAAYEPWPFNTKYDIAVLVGKIPTEEVSPVEKQSLDRFVGQYSPGDKKRCVGSLKHWQNTLADTLWETLEGI